MSRSEGVSVILTLFGPGREQVLRCAVQSLRLQSLAPEIIVSEQAAPGSEAYSEAARALEVDYVCSYPERGPQGEAYFSKGRAYNVGFDVSSRRHVYFSDPDVLFLSGRFLRDAVALLRSDTGLCLVEPKMIRLTEHGRTEFCEDAVAGRPIGGLGGPDDPPWLCDYREGRLVRAAEDLELREEDGALVMASTARLAEQAEGEGRTPAEALWEPTVHRAAVLCSAETFTAAEGFCEDYLVWGYEDQDFKWKAAAVARLTPMPGITLHLQHPKEYAERYSVERNRFLFESRKLKGLQPTIARDRSAGDSFWTAARQGDFKRARAFLVKPGDPR